MEGVINLDKPSGLSSARVVDAVKRLLPRGGRLLKTVTSDVPEELVRKILSGGLVSSRAGLHDS